MIGKIGKVATYAFIICGTGNVLVWVSVAISSTVWGWNTPLPVWWAAMMVPLFAAQIGGAVVGAVAAGKHLRKGARS